MLQRILTVGTSVALVGAIFAGIPTSARANGFAPQDDTWVATTGSPNGSTAGTSCADPGFVVDGIDDQIEVGNAIFDVNESGTVHLCPGTYHFSYGVETEKGNFTLRGGGATNTVIDGANSSRILSTTGSITIENLTAQNARGFDFDEGGAVLAGGTVTTINANFHRNFANKGGGAIAAGGTVIVNNSAFTNNSANDQGGAIASHQFVVANGSSFSGNSSIADENCVGGGGAIAAIDDVTVNNSRFSGNSAVFGTNTDRSACNSSGNFGGYGGAIATGAFEFVYDSTFTKNRAVIAGGAIFSANITPTRDPEAIISGSTFVGNDLVPSAGDITFLPGFSQVGSAVAAFSEAPLSISNSTFINNGHLDAVTRGDALSSSGGTVFGVLVNVSGSAFTGNTSGVGAAVLSLGSAQISDTTFLGNRATYFGGAILTAPYLGEGTLSVENSRFVKNRALWGGAIWTQAVTEIRSSLFRQNSATSAGTRGSWVRSVSGLGGAIAAFSATTISDSRFVRNRAQVSGGAAYFMLGAKGSLALMSGNRFIGNVADKSGGAIGYNLADVGSLPTRADIARARRANSFVGNVAPRGPLMGAVNVSIIN